jgi:hypothetical protein
LIALYELFDLLVDGCLHPVCSVLKERIKSFYPQGSLKRGRAMSLSVVISTVAQRNGEIFELCLKGFIHYGRNDDLELLNKNYLKLLKFAINNNDHK